MTSKPTAIAELLQKQLGQQNDKQTGPYARPRPVLRSPENCCSVSSLRSETGASAPDEVDWRSEAAKIVRAWWAEAKPSPGWHMGRELSIRKRLVRLDGDELVNGAMTMLRVVAPDVERPYSLRLFYGKKSTPLYEQCKSEWLKSQGPQRVRPSLRIAQPPEAA
jgi:hypothetical protein